MLYFQCDYAEGCHPKVLARLNETNFCQSVGYGLDPYCDHARQLIREACAAPDADVHFLIGGTQTNFIAVDTCLRGYQGVLCPTTGHIACHETGAVEATGHKVLALPTENGKLTADQVRAAVEEHFASPTHEHTVQPGMVYISHPTENGLLYTKDELSALYDTCRACGLYLFVDGARMGYGLTSPASDLTLPELAAHCDLFYIGGTKCGALFGEALVINASALKTDFRYRIKQNGAMLAKGRLLGLQFEALFTDGLYEEICGRAVKQALRVREAFEARGIPMAHPSYTNQQFPILSNRQIADLREKYVFEDWEPWDAEHTVVRFCTSWATREENLETLLNDIAELERE